jgi:hypothetical protein
MENSCTLLCSISAQHSRKAARSSAQWVKSRAQEPKGQGPTCTSDQVPMCIIDKDPKVPKDQKTKRSRVQEPRQPKSPMVQEPKKGPTCTSDQVPKSIIDKYPKGPKDQETKGPRAQGRPKSPRARRHKSPREAQ